MDVTDPKTYVNTAVQCIDYLANPAVEQKNHLVGLDLINRISHILDDPEMYADIKIKVEALLRKNYALKYCYLTEDHDCKNKVIGPEII